MFIHSLSESFPPVAMIASFLDSSEKVEQAICAKFYQLKNPSYSNA